MSGFRAGEKRLAEGIRDHGGEDQGTMQPALENAGLDGAMAGGGTASP